MQSITGAAATRAAPREPRTTRRTDRANCGGGSNGSDRVTGTLAGSRHLRCIPQGPFLGRALRSATGATATFPALTRNQRLLSSKCVLVPLLVLLTKICVLPSAFRVLPGPLRTFARAHASRAYLTIEVAGSAPADPLMVDRRRRRMGVVLRTARWARPAAGGAPSDRAGLLTACAGV
jgi:hypothetical protein